MFMGPLVSYRAGTWLVDEYQIVFFMILVSWIPRIPVLCSPESSTAFFISPVKNPRDRPVSYPLVGA